MLLLSVLMACSTENEQETEDHGSVHWEYEGEGAPDNWGDLNDEYELCGTGVEQSPIDLHNATEIELENIDFSYTASAVNILNNGHTIQLNYDEGSNIVLNGVTYSLLQFHFHAPSEHTVDGESYPLEMHLVHADADGNLAVVGVLIEEGEENAALQEVWNMLPTEKSDVEETDLMIDAMALLPEDQQLYRYAGSLTTPPCSEGVVWSVMASPIQFSAEQIKTFTDIFANTNRPVQPIFDRALQIDLP